MHCIEIKSRDLQAFAGLVKNNGGAVSIISRYKDSNVTILDVEVSKDTRAIHRIEQRFGYSGQ